MAYYRVLRATERWEAGWTLDTTKTWDHPCGIPDALARALVERGYLAGPWEGRPDLHLFPVPYELRRESDPSVDEIVRADIARVMARKHG